MGSDRAGLAAAIYTHFTSPIRRYADVVVHRMLGATIGIEALPPGYNDKDAVRKICDTINERAYSAQVGFDAGAGRTRGTQHQRARWVPMRTICFVQRPSPRGNKPTPPLAYSPTGVATHNCSACPQMAGRDSVQLFTRVYFKDRAQVDIHASAGRSVSPHSVYPPAVCAIVKPRLWHDRALLLGQVAEAVVLRVRPSGIGVLVPRFGFEGFIRLQSREQWTFDSDALSLTWDSSSSASMELADAGASRIATAPAAEDPSGDEEGEGGWTFLQVLRQVTAPWQSDIGTRSPLTLMPLL